MMKKRIKKILAFVSSAAIAATMITVPIAAEAAVGDTWKYDFGATPAEGWTQVTAADAYTDAKGYGFLGQNDETYDLPGVVDGYTQDESSATPLKDGGSGDLTDYVYTEKDNMPIRFAQKVSENTYYKVKVTMGHSDKDSKIYLTSERRHFILMEEELKEGDELVKEFTVAVHSVRWKDPDNGRRETVYTDNMLNICVYGTNPMINSIEIEQIEKPKVVWVFGDSTVTDGSTGVPWFGYNTYAGWGISVAKYLPSDVAVVNLGEGGLNTGNTSYFDMGKNDITEGDIILFQMGHNDSGYVRPDYYYNAAVDKKATLVVCSPIERLNQYSTKDFDPQVKAYAEEKNIPFVSLFDVTTKIYSDLGDLGRWYTHSCMYTGNPVNPGTERDATHLNDFGAAMTAKQLFAELDKIDEQFPVLTPYLAAHKDVKAIEPDPLIMRNGNANGNIVQPPNSFYPLPEAGINYEQLVDITSAEVVDDASGSYLKSFNTVRHSNLTYITAFAATYDKDGRLFAMKENRLEPMSAKTVERVTLTDDTNTQGLEIPEGGSYKTFIWGGAFSDGSMTYQPYSTTFSGYKAANTITVAEENGLYTLQTPVKSGQVMAKFNITFTGDSGSIVLSPTGDGSETNGIKLNVNASTGVLSMDVPTVDSEGNPTTTPEILIDSLKKGQTREVSMIYDIDHGILTINVDGVGIIHKAIPNAITLDAITPAQILSYKFTGATVENMTVSELVIDPLPEKKINITYDETMGSVEAPASAAQNTYVTLKAAAKEPDANNVYIFGGWYYKNGDLFRKDAEISFYLIDDMDLEAKFFIQQGVEATKDFTFTADKTLVKVGTEEQIAITIDNIVDESGNPVNYKPEDIQLSASDNLTITDNKLTIPADFDIDGAEKKDITITCKIGEIEKQLVISVHSYDVVENFDDIKDAWGFTGNGGAKPVDGTIQLLPSSKADGNQTDVKTFDAPISTASKIHIMFDWQSLVESGKGRHSDLRLLDSSDNLIFLVRGVGNGSLFYSTTTADDTGYKSFAGFSHNWYSIDLTIDFTAKTINGTIKDSDGKTAKEFNDEPLNSSATNFAKIYAINTWSLAPMSIDNVIIKAFN